MRVFPEEVNICVVRLSKEDAVTSVGGHLQASEGLNRIQRQKKDQFALCWSWNIRAILPLDIGAPSSWDFRLGPGVGDHGPPSSQALGFGLELHSWLSWASSL